MRREFIYIMLMVVAVVASSCGATRRMARREPLEIQPERLSLSAVTSVNPYVVPVEYTVVVPKRYVTSRAQVQLVPYFTNGDKRLNLTPIIINGKQVARRGGSCVDYTDIYMEYGDQMQYLSDGDYGVIKVREAVVFQPWMQMARLRVATICNTCSGEMLMDSRTLAYGVRFNPPKRVVAKVKKTQKPTKKSVVTEKKTMNVMVHYNIGSAVIDSNLGDNGKELDELMDFIKESVSDSTITVTKIKLTGISSPDGVYDDNMKLAKSRATSLENYIDSNMPQLADVTTIDYVAENWSGLYKCLNSSEKDGAKELVKELRGASNDQIRNDIMYKSPLFPYLRSEVLPKLRMTTCEIDYVVKELAK